MQDPSATRRSRSERVLVRWLFRHALQRGAATAWLDGAAPPADGDPRPEAAGPARPVDWASLAAGVLDAAERLRAAGVMPGQRVVTALANGRSAVWGALALQAIGAVEVPWGVDADAAAIARHLPWIGAQHCLADPHRFDLREALGPRCLMLDPQVPEPVSPAELRRALRATDAIDPTTPCLILRTSGTTAAPRDVVLSWHALASNAAGKLAAVPQSEQDVRLTVLPLAHAYARTCDLGTWLISGGVLAATSGWQGFCRLAPAVRPTVMNMVPSLAQRLLAAVRRDAAVDADRPPPPLLERAAVGAVEDAVEDASADAVERATERAVRRRWGIDRLRLLGCGGAALDADAFDGFGRWGITVIQGYGLTEAGPVICSASPRDARCGSVGRAVAGWQLRLDDQGRLWARGPGRMIQYWNDPRATARKIHDGWLDTGDLAEVDADGCWRILGRHDDTIVLTSGWKVHPWSIEQRLTRVAGVARAVVFGDGRRLGVIVQLEPALAGESPPRPDDLRGRFDVVLADRPRHERPVRVVVLPRPLSAEAGELTVKGTVRRAAVVARWAPPAAVVEIPMSNNR